MAEILPSSTDLNATTGNIIENVDFGTVTFSYSLETDEVFTDLEIIDFSVNEGVTVDKSSISGSYINIFRLTNAIKYRDGDELKACDSFLELPKGKLLYEYVAPAGGSLVSDFSYTVKLKYNELPPAPPPTTSPSDRVESGDTTPTTPPEPIPREITKTYSHKVYGNWSIWANQMKQYLDENG